MDVNINQSQIIWKAGSYDINLIAKTQALQNEDEVKLTFFHLDADTLIIVIITFKIKKNLNQTVP